MEDILIKNKTGQKFLVFEWLEDLNLFINNVNDEDKDEDDGDDESTDNIQNGD